MIPFNKQYFSSKGIKYIEDAILSDNNNYIKRCEKFLENNFLIEKVLLTTSCTHSLELAMILIDLKKGDEVILPSYTFVSTANAIVLRGGVPVFCDIKEDTLNIDESKIESLITKKTKAVIPVHYAGVPCDMNSINRIAKKYNLYVVEDAAQALNSKYKGKYLGTLGDIGCYSFHKTKNFSMGEGGAIAINNQKFIPRAEVIREKGTNKNSFMRGETNKYTWVDVGSSYIPSNINSAYLFSQLEEIKSLQDKRDNLYMTYYSNLEYLAKKGMIVLPAYQGNSHIFYIILDTSKSRDTLLYFLDKNKIQATFHFLPLHKSSYYKKKFNRISLPITEKLSGRILRLPLYYELNVTEINRICKLIGDFFEK